ncbi:hypothetical protein [Inquilinus sp.]|uniref:hypothetical protein n=1 Tax=Inquilinus sp. TaxID=1932117 RepID=UPI0031E265E1
MRVAEIARAWAGLASLLALLMLFAASSGPAEGGEGPARPAMAPPPDEQAVTAQEFRGAVDDGSSAALIRFIARHPDQALAEEARRRLAGRTVPDGPALAGDPDAAVYAAFDAARRAGTARAYRDFARAYAGHPLAAEADRQALALP